MGVGPVVEGIAVEGEEQVVVVEGISTKLLV